MRLKATLRAPPRPPTDPHVPPPQALNWAPAFDILRAHVPASVKNENRTAILHSYKSCSSPTAHATNLVIGITP